jgi:ribose transport system permease protein
MAERTHSDRRQPGEAGAAARSAWRGGAKIMTSAVAAKTPPPRFLRSVRNGLGRLGLLAIVAVLWVVFSLLAPGFLSHFNLNSLGRSLGVDIVVGFSQMVVLASGGMNLSVGAIGVCSVMMIGYLLQTIGLPIPLAVGGGLALGALLGWLNGFAIVKSGVNSFVATLASASLFSGGMLILSKAQLFNALPPELGAFGQAHVGGLPTLLVVALGIGAALVVLYGFTVTGRQLLAAGANPRAAAMSGVPVNRMTILAHSLSGLLAGAAGALLVAKLGGSLPSAAGDDWLLPSFLGPVIGGTLLSGGVVSVIGTVVGAALVSTIRSGLLILQVGNFWLQLFLGAALLGAVMIERYRSVMAEKRGAARR